MQNDTGFSSLNLAEENRTLRREIDEYWRERVLSLEQQLVAKAVQLSALEAQVKAALDGAWTSLSAIRLVRDNHVAHT